MITPSLIEKRPNRSNLVTRVYINMGSRVTSCADPLSKQLIKYRGSVKLLYKNKCVELSKRKARDICRTP